MHGLPRFATLNTRPLLLVPLVLQSVLCATWTAPPVSGFSTFHPNGTTRAATDSGAGEASYSVGRDQRSLVAFGFGDDAVEGEPFHGGTGFSLYPTQWGREAEDTGSELVRLVEGEYDQDADSLALTDQPFLRDHLEEADDDGDLQLFGGDQLDGSFAVSSVPGHAPSTARYHFGHFQPGQSDTDVPNGQGFDGSVYDQPASAHAPSAPNQTKDFFRGVLQRFGVSRPPESLQPADLPSSGIQRLLPHRFRPHFVNTSKGLRNIPHQLNDGQLQLAPEDALTGTPSIGGQPSGASGTGTGGKQSGNSGTIGTLFNSFKHKLKAIYPGTVWCGDGNQAKSEDDIGFFYLTDSCCRAHDLCPITIAAGEQFNRLKNNGHFTRSHCDCDKKFFNCLKNANTLVSRQIGYTYFNLLKPKCFRHEHPKVDCTKRSRGKCLTYVVDEKQPKQWQWFDNLIF